jgi:catechol 2,3-dioxygenase-like lactoylglutathione lyase family enzyme
MNVRGVDHLAIVSDDMPAAMDFYTRVMGFRLVHVRRVPYEQDRWQPPYDNLRHYFFDMGNDSLLAFFEMPKGKEPRAKRDGIGGMQHVAFAVTPAQFAALQARLKKAGVAIDGPLDVLPGLVSVYFIDPVNGIRLEACCQPAAGEQPRVIDSVYQKGVKHDFN